MSLAQDSRDHHHGTSCQIPVTNLSVRMRKLMKPYFGCLRKSQANRTCCSWVTSVTQTFVGKAAQWCTNSPSVSWGALRTASCYRYWTCCQGTVQGWVCCSQTKMTGWLKHSSDKLVGFKILLSMLKTSSRLNFGRANFSMLRAQMRGIPWEASMDGKRTCESWELFKNSPLETQEQSVPYEGEEEGRARDHPGLTMSFWVFRWT